MKKVLYFIVPLSILLFSMNVSAVFLDRGGGLIYETDRNITWLQDVNYAYTSGYQLYNPRTYQGRMTWAEAMTWAENLVYEGYDDWRLPTTLVPDPSCNNSVWATGYNCRGSELGIQSWGIQ